MNWSFRRGLSLNRSPLLDIGEKPSSTADGRGDALHRAAQGQVRVEPICRTLEIAPSTYCAVRSRPPSARRQHDEELKPKVERVHADNYGVYGAEKVWRQLRRDGVEVGRDRTARLMAELGLAGITRSARKRTTVPAATASRPEDLVGRNSAPRRPTDCGWWT